MASMLMVDAPPSLGNPSMYITVLPDRHSLWRADFESEQLAEQIIEFLVANGAYKAS